MTEVHVVLRHYFQVKLGFSAIKQHPAWRQASEFSVGIDPIRADDSARIHEIRYRDIAF